MIIEQGGKSWEVEPLSRDGTLVEGFYGAESTTDGFELTKVAYDGDGESVEVIGDSPLGDTPDSFALTTLEPRENPEEDELPVSLNTMYDTRSIRASTPTGVEEGEDTSKLFLYGDSEGVSLVVIHDSPETDTGGEATFNFDELPEGEWVVEDGPGDIRRTGAKKVVNWRWNSEETDGGAYRFGAEEFSFNLKPSFESGIDSWEFLADDAEEPRRIQLDLNEQVTVRVGGTEEVSVSTTVISFVPGREDEFVNRNASAFPDSGREPLPEAPFLRPDAFYGDGVEAESADIESGLPKSLDVALNQTKRVEEKQIDELTLESESRRIHNTLNLSYKIDKGEVDFSEGIDIKVNIRPPTDDVSSIPANITILDEELPDTVVHDEDYYTVLQDPVDSDIPGINLPLPIPIENYSDSQTKPPTTFKRHLYARNETLENPSGEEMDAIRASTIWGAVNSYVEDVLDKARNDPALRFLPLPSNPIVYSWIEIALLADGTRYVRIPDTSVFPRHELYVDGIKKRTSEFVVTESVVEKGYAAEYNQDTNDVWEEFKRESKEGSGFIPYRSPHSTYIEQYDESPTPDYFPGHPVMTYGADAQGSPVSKAEVDRILGEPLDPFANAG